MAAFIFDIIEEEKFRTVSDSETSFWCVIPASLIERIFVANAQDITALRLKSRISTKGLNRVRAPLRFDFIEDANTTMPQNFGGILQNSRPMGWSAVLTLGDPWTNGDECALDFEK